MDKLITIREFCERYGVSRSTAYRENRAGRLPFRKVGRATRIVVSDAQAWFEQLPAR